MILVECIEQEVTGLGSVCSEFHGPSADSKGTLPRRAQDLVDLLRADPFEPFTIWLTDGTKYDIHHPAFAIVDNSKITLGLPTDQSPDRPAERTVYIAVLHIRRIEPMAQPAAS
jgi:hypothetical protein